MFHEGQIYRVEARREMTRRPHRRILSRTESGRYLATNRSIPEVVAEGLVHNINTRVIVSNLAQLEVQGRQTERIYDANKTPPSTRVERLGWDSALAWPIMS
jgi:hypothetical protein